MSHTARQTQKAGTRGKIIEAACAVFSARGIRAARMSDVAEAAGVSHGTVFLHFKTQEELVCEVIGAYGRTIAARTHELAAGASGVREILAAHLSGIEEYEPFYTRLALEAPLLPAACRGAWVGMQSVIASHLAQAVEREAEAGRIKALPAYFIFNTWMGLVTYYLANGDLFAPGGSVVARCGQELQDHFMALIEQEPKR